MCVCETCQNVFINTGVYSEFRIAHVRAYFVPLTTRVAAVAACLKSNCLRIHKRFRHNKCTPPSLRKQVGYIIKCSLTAIVRNDSLSRCYRHCRRRRRYPAAFPLHSKGKCYILAHTHDSFEIESRAALYAKLDFITEERSLTLHSPLSVATQRSRACLGV